MISSVFGQSSASPLWSSPNGPWLERAGRTIQSPLWRTDRDESGDHLETGYGIVAINLDSEQRSEDRVHELKQAVQGMGGLEHSPIAPTSSDSNPVSRGRCVALRSSGSGSYCWK